MRSHDLCQIECHYHRSCLLKSNIGFGIILTQNSRDPTMVKKLYRCRLKKINTFYSSLPPVLHKKKLSVPAKVSLVLKYIRKLQQQVERLAKKKEEISSRISRQADLFHETEHRRSTSTTDSSLFSISASWVRDTEIIIQISTYKGHDVQLSEILFYLEKDGLLLYTSSFESFGAIVFYNLHFQVMQMERDYRLECEVLVKKILSLYKKKEELP